MTLECWYCFKRGLMTTGPGATHVCGAISSVVPDVVHQGGQVLQAVRDVVRKQQDTHGLEGHHSQSHGQTAGIIFREGRIVCQKFPLQFAYVADTRIY